MGRSRFRIAAVTLAFGFAQAATLESVPAAAMCETSERSSEQLLDGAGLAMDALRHRPAVSTVNCRVTAAALRADSTPRVMVDLRAAKDVSVASIPGAVNLGLESLANHLIVKSAARVVLVGDGKNTPRLLRQCEELHERGLLQIEVLDGGIPAWRRAGGVIAGDAGVLDQPLLLTERELHEALHQPDAMLVLTQGRPTPGLKASGARIVQASQESRSIRTILNRLHAALARKTAAVIVLPEGRDPTPWRAAARDLALPEPLFFVGDVTRYDAYVEQQERIAKTAKQPRSGACEQG